METAVTILSMVLLLPFMLTRISWWYLIPATVLINIISWLVLGPLYRREERERRMRFGHCPECDYDLRESPDRCPECGTVTPKKNQPQITTDSHR